MKSHLKRLAAPKTWKIKRKGIKYIIRPFPSGHSMSNGLPLSVILTQIGATKTEKETNLIIKNKAVLVDGKIAKNRKNLVGLFDTLSIPSIKEFYRISFSTKGELILVKTDEKESKIKIGKIKNKTALGKKFQITLHDGKTFLTTDNTLKPGDSLLISLPETEIKEKISFAAGNTIFLIGGSNIGETGKVQSIETQKVVFKNKKGEIKETEKKFAIIVGKDNPLIKLE